MRQKFSEKRELWEPSKVLVKGMVMERKARGKTVMKVELRDSGAIRNGK